MKNFFLGGLFLFTYLGLLNAQTNHWIIAEPGDMEAIIESQGYKIEKSWDGLPEEFSDMVVTTTSFYFPAMDDINYNPRVSVKIAQNGIFNYNFFDLASCEQVLKTFECTKEGIPYTVYVGNLAIVYAVPVIPAGNKLFVYTAIILDRKMREFCSYDVASVSKRVYAETGDKLLIEFPTSFGYTQKQLHQKIGNASRSNFSGRKGCSYDAWDDRGFFIYYDESMALQEIEMTSIGDSEDCRYYDRTVFGIRLFCDIHDVIAMHGEPHEVVENKYEWEDPKLVWKLLNYTVTVEYSNEETPFYCNRTIYPGSVTGISVTEIVRTSITQ